MHKYRMWGGIFDLAVVYVEKISGSQLITNTNQQYDSDTKRMH